jgi:hypothetical protein
LKRAEEYINWTKEQVRKVLWSEEFPFVVSYNTEIPLMKYYDHGEVLISTKEYVRDITVGATAAVFEPHVLRLNPGLVDSFPMLSQLAQNYSEYEVIQMVYTYKSLITDSALTTAGQVGSMVMTVIYNANQDYLPDKQQMISNDQAAECRP